MAYTILGIISTALAIFLIWYRNRKPDAIDNIFKEEDRKRELRLLNNELKTLSMDSSDLVDELNRIKSTDNDK